MKIRLLYFAVLRDISGTPEVQLEVPDGTTARGIWEKLRGEYPALAVYAQPPLTAINESYAAAETVLKDGDELAFIPPVAGG